MNAELHLAHLFDRTVAEHGDRLATRIKRNDKWVVQTYRQLDEAITRVARALVDSGVQKGDRVALFASNCPEWTTVDFAVARIGAVLVPLYATSTPEQILHIARDSGVSLMVIGGESEVERVLEARVMQGAHWPVVSINRLEHDEVQQLDDWAAAVAGDRVAGIDEEIERRMAAASGDDLSSIVYTSGTTGDPKGVMLGHEALVRQVDAVSSMFPITCEDHSLAFLPLSHALERAWQMVVVGNGCLNTYCDNPRNVSQMLVEVQPTLLVSVPKLFETVYRVAHEQAAASPVKKRIFDWAFRVGGQMQRAHRKGKQPSPVWTSQFPLADKLVLSNVRKALGGHKTVMACGGAPIRKEVEEFISAAGVPMYCGYGLTEASPLVSFNAPGAFRVSSAGRVMEGGEIRIGVDSEVLYRGSNVMLGYWNQPEATKDAIDDEGWLHTGDAGYVDAEGFLWITDRIKDIIVTSGGKNVAPQPIEGMVLADPLFEHAVLIGEGRPTLTMLVRPSMPALEDLAKRLNLKGGPAEWLNNEQVLAEMRQRVEQLTEKLPSHEKIRDLRASREEFTLENGLLTPTLKVRRREVEKRFQELIDEMYARMAARRGGRREDKGEH